MKSKPPFILSPKFSVKRDRCKRKSLLTLNFGDIMKSQEPTKRCTSLYLRSLFTLIGLFQHCSSLVTLLGLF